MKIRNNNEQYNKYIYTQIVYKGNKGNNLIAYLNKSNTPIFDINKSANEMIFYIYNSDINKIKKLNLDNYNLTINSENIKPTKNKVYKCISVLISIVIVIMSIYLCQNRLFFIKISGTENLNNNDIISALDDVGIKKTSYMNFDCKDIENYLYDTFDVSLVSVIKRGNCLIINIKEEIKDSRDEYLPIVAPCDMIISSIDVYAGTSNVITNSIVYAGDEIVCPYYYINGAKCYIKPSAKIIAKTFLTESYNFQNMKTEKMRTGNSVCIESDMFLGKHLISHYENQNTFSEYETIESSFSFDYILPIKFKKIIAYELESAEINNDFESSKDDILLSLQNSCRNKLMPCMEIYDEYENIINLENGYIISYTLCCDVVLNY